MNAIDVDYLLQQIGAAHVQIAAMSASLKQAEAMAQQHVKEIETLKAQIPAETPAKKPK